MRRKLSAFLAMLLSICLLSGCSVTGVDAQTLMSPPNANADQQEIRRLMQGDSADVTFAYPKNGEYRSAVIMQDFTGDGNDDAVGFVLMDTGGVEVKFFSKNQGGIWRVAASFRNPATQVDRVCFGDLSGNGSQEVIIGWGNTQNNMSAAMCVYTYDNGVISEIQAEDTYGGMTLTDFDEDGIWEIFAVQRPVPAAEENKQSKPARAQVICMQGGKLVPKFSAEADSSIVKYSSLLFGKVAKNCMAVVLDGAKADSSMTTQIFYINDAGQMVNIPPNVNNEAVANPLYRPPGAGGISYDINGDGIIEFPVVSLLPAITDLSTVDSTSFRVDWSALNLKDLSYKKVKRTLMNHADGYWFVLPASIAEKTTAINDAKLKAVTYYSVIETTNAAEHARIGSPLFTIRVFTKSAWEQRGQVGGYEVLAAKRDYVYGIDVFTTNEEALGAIARIKQSFQVED